jgi:hypothetical protein
MAGLTETSHLILALDAHADALCARSIDEACSGAFWTERFGERGTRRIKEDAHHHISHLKTALQFDDPSVLAKYAVWLQQVLTHRGMCSRHLAEHFDALARAIHRAALPGAASAESFLGVAVDALRYQSGPAGPVQEAADVLAASVLNAPDARHMTAPSGADHLESDLGYLLSYLMDAVALDRPDVFQQYVVWIDGYFTRRDRPRGYLARILQALDASLSVTGDEVRAACRPIVSAARPSLDESMRG